MRKTPFPCRENKTRVQNSRKQIRSCDKFKYRNSKQQRLTKWEMKETGDPITRTLEFGLLQPNRSSLIKQTYLERVDQIIHL